MNPGNKVSVTPGVSVDVRPGPGLMAQVVTMASRTFARPVIAMWSRSWRMPWPYFVVDLAAVFLPAVRGTSRVRVHLRHCEAEYSRPTGTTSPEWGAILYLHGGAWLVGGLRSHRRLVSRLARATGLPVLAVNYRKLPHASISDALEDCLDGYRRLEVSGVATDRIAIVGDSAGGYFALQVALQAVERGHGAPGAVACISPLVDPEPTSKLAGPAVADPLFPRSALTAMWEMALAAEEDPRSAIPLLRRPALATAADLSVMPPTLIQVGGGEILRPDSEDFAARLAAAGGEVALEIYPGQIHVFQAAADLVPEARRAVDSIAQHINRALGRRMRAAA